MEMAGAVLGVLIQKVLPNWLYLTLAGIILGLTAYKTFSKYFQTHKKEVELQREHEAAVIAQEADIDGEPDANILWMVKLPKSYLTFLNAAQTPWETQRRNVPRMTLLLR
jgi:hypothetical protein